MSMHPNRNLFAEFKKDHKVFVETGTYRGDGIQLALDAGFNRVLSIDSDINNIEFCRDRFGLRSHGRRDIELHCVDSSDGLANIISDINEPIMFWLDAHAQYLEGEEESANPYPLMWELKQIEKHMIRTRRPHTILIDDMLHLTHPEITGWTKRAIEDTINEMYGRAAFPWWGIQYFANPVKKSILLAHTTSV